MRTLAIPTLIGLLTTAAGCGSSPTAPTTPPAARHVGGETCVACHAEQHEAWRGSHHDLAMQPATDATVLGDFDDATFEYHGVTSTFFRREGGFGVRTDGPDGKLADYEIAYTFGVEPLQQYLIEFPDGRLQALSICWDTRSAEQGGQRWFHLYPEERVDHEDELHWTGPNQNWNFMCSECHSTRVRKGYRPDEDRYETTWSEIDVSCEACHGPGSRHVAWAESPDDDPSLGLVLRLKDDDDGSWVLDRGTGQARRSVPRVSRTEVELCARCHSRRSLLSEAYVHGRPLADTHRPALLIDPLYHADGQIHGEVYVYGSFLQSKMYREGVTCRDCHDPHGLGLHGSVDTVCARCHLPARFDTPEHHFHPPDSAGASCVACHMPKTDYMVVDPRGDHSFRVPRPDLSVALGTPNACGDCHADRDAAWAASQVAAHHPPPEGRHYGEALHAARSGLPGADALLREVVADDAAPGIVRATALVELYPGPESRPLIEGGLRDRDPLVRLAALRAMQAFPPPARSAALPLLDDPLRLIRIEAANLLASARGSSLGLAQRERLESVLEEYRQVQHLNADRAESYHNLGLLHLALGQLEQAEAAYRSAIDRRPSFLPAYVNLADLYRERGQDDLGEEILREALRQDPSFPAAQYSLGLLLARQSRLDEAREYLGQAARMRPEEPRYSYAWGVALHSEGQVDRALEVLDAAQRRHPADRDLLVALATMSRDAGSIDEAIGYATKLARLSPEDPAARQLLESLQALRR